MKSKMEIEAPTFDLGIESDFEDQSNLIVEDSLEKDGENLFNLIVEDSLEKDEEKDFDNEVNSHNDVEGRKEDFKHNFDLNEVPNEVVDAVLDLNKLPNDNEEQLERQDNEEEVERQDNEEEVERHVNEEIKTTISDMLNVYVQGL
ncbi:hypothetical protein P8452_63248 [Trifolium repens]|nr:hypothetical protein P8452_63248 [Trifolium repens]